MSLAHCVVCYDLCFDGSIVVRPDRANVRVGGSSEPQLTCGDS